MDRQSRTKNTVAQLAGHPEWFDRFTKDGGRGRIRWAGSMPSGYDNKAGLPWGQVRGRYWPTGR